MVSMSEATGADSTERQRRHLVRLAVQSDLPDLRVNLVEAFMADPVVAWVYPDIESRRTCLTEWYDLMLVVGLKRGHTYTVSDNKAGAIWSPPAVSQMFDWETDGVAMAEMLRRHLGSRTQHVLEGLLELETAHPRHFPHFYLAMLGTSPDMQGKGLAGALLDEVLCRCDREGWPAYLETSLEHNVRFYERRQFRVTASMQLPKGPTVWFMWREQQPVEV